MGLVRPEKAREPGEKWALAALAVQDRLATKAKARAGDRAELLAVGSPKKNRRARRTKSKSRKGIKNDLSPSSA